MTAWQWVGLVMAVSPFVGVFGWMMWAMADIFGWGRVIFGTLGVLAVICFVEVGAFLASGQLTP